MYEDKELITVNQALVKVREAIQHTRPFSLVRIGDGENLILAQDSVMTLDHVLKEKWVKQANKGMKGITLPNLAFRDDMIKAIKAADLVGVPFKKNDPILTEDRLKGELTDKIFDHYNLHPKAMCHTFVNRVFAQKKAFWDALKGKKIMLIGQWSEASAELLRKKPYKLKVNLSLPFTHNDQLEHTIDIVRLNQKHFDVALVCCGVNSVVLAPRIAELTGKVAIDFGKSLMFMVKNRAGLTHSSDRAHLGLIP